MAAEARHAKGSDGPVETRRDREREVARIAAFSDGVFAIAITLLALQLEVPKDLSGGIGPFLDGLWPNFLSFLISFLVIGIYWVAHHRLFASIIDYDGRLIWLNLLVLLFIVLLPFTTELIGEHGEHGLAVAVYALSVGGAGLSTAALAAYALVGHRLCRQTVSERVIKFTVVRAVAVPLVFIGSLALLPLGADWPKYAWLAIPLVERLVHRFLGSPGEV